ncbi:MAG: hypothetical protein HOP12_08975 [Candidatus Eisenbacteria bacterium]|uniref:Zf-HC2 domain-containing protein n=1 Tax=Eiseniibacteriota bacterium TaxID=2212470 RepID=A0A849SI65_UNCEI|nr:hypothetical protein [Candidatus Eisenbacteria bacterium]
MNCEGFERELDSLGAAALSTAARDHALACTHCAPRLRATFELEALLDDGPAAGAPHRFTDQVMARVVLERDDRAVALGAALATEWSDARPLWVRVCAEPAVALSVVLTGVLVWAWPLGWRVASRAAESLAGWSNAVIVPGTNGVVLAATGGMGSGPLRDALLVAVACAVLGVSATRLSWERRHTV